MRGTLREDARLIAAANLLMAEEFRALSADFASAGIPVLFVKGLTLGMLAYGDIATKAAVDIDLLIEPHALPDAAALLDAHGYQRVQPEPAMTMTQLAAWHALRKESTWLKRGSRLQVDLHTRLADNDRLIPAIGIGLAAADGRAVARDRAADAKPRRAVRLSLRPWRVERLVPAQMDLRPGCFDRTERRACGLTPQQRGTARRGPGCGAGAVLADRLFGTLDGACGLRTELNRDRANRLLSADRVQPAGGTGRAARTDRRGRWARRRSMCRSFC